MPVKLISKVSRRRQRACDASSVMPESNRAWNAEIPEVNTRSSRQSRLSHSHSSDFRTTQLFRCQPKLFWDIRGDVHGCFALSIPSQANSKRYHAFALRKLLAMALYFFLVIGAANMALIIHELSIGLTNFDMDEGRPVSTQSNSK